MPANRTYTSLVRLALLALIWGSSFVWIKVGPRGFTPMHITDDGPTVASTVTYLIPVVAVLFAAAALGESLSLQVYVGMVVVLAGVGLIQRTAARPPIPAAAPAKPVGAAAGDTS